MASDAEGRRKAMAAVNDIFERYKILVEQGPQGRKYYDQQLMNSLTLLDASPRGTVLYRLVLGAEYSNLNDVMHGGAAGVIFDMCTTTALAPLLPLRADATVTTAAARDASNSDSSSSSYFFLGGVTRALNISYLRAVPIGETVHVRCWVVAAGQRMAMIRAEMMSATDDMRVYCTAEHHKVNVPAKRAHWEVVTSWDREIGRVVNGKTPIAATSTTSRDSSGVAVMDKSKL